MPWNQQGDVAEQYATQLLLNEKILKKTGYGDIVIFRLILHPDIYQCIGFSYYADQKDAEVGKESIYGYDIQVDSDYKITIKKEVLQLEWICGDGEFSFIGENSTAVKNRRVDRI